MDIIYILYNNILKVYPRNPLYEDRDRFVLSKGQGCLALYAVLADKGFFPKEELYKFATRNSFLGGHPDMNKVPGVELSTGSLGHGLPMAIGMALGLKICKSESRVYVLVGDGECNEGTIWESALLAAHHNLTNLTCIIDYNHSTDRALKMGNIAEKFEAFGWDAKIIDGHSHHQIMDALVEYSLDRPSAIVANTIKGYGIKEMENNPAWHHRGLTKEELVSFLEELR